VTESQSLLTIPANLAETNFQGIITGDKSWLAYLIESDAMFASFPVEMTPRVWASISSKIVMIALFLMANRRLILDAVPKGSKYNQDCLIANLLPALGQVRAGNAHHKAAKTLMVHMEGSMCHNGAKIMEKRSFKGLERAPHPAD
jgi:hypothetical protein